MDLPTPLIMDILSRLPPKSLLRFRCVSKSWKYLIDDSHFVYLHLQHSLKNNTNHALIINSYELYIVEFPTLKGANIIDHPLKCDSIGTELLGSCNGLLCLSNGEGHGKRGTIIYNPVTKKCREVPATKVERPDYFTWYERLVYGFGYDQANDDYKVVRIIQFNNERPNIYDSEVKVFSLKANSWRRVQDFPHKYLLSYKRQRGIYVNSCLHWMVTLKPESDGSKLILAFDLNSEDYKVLPLPKYSVGEAHLNVEVLQHGLCLLINYPRIRSEVWVMKEYGMQESWTKLFTVVQGGTGRFEYVRPISYSKDGSKVLLEQDAEKYIWYDVKRQTVEKVNIRGMPSNPEAITLVESLVLGSRKTHKNKKSNEQKQLRNADISRNPLDPENATSNMKKDQQALDKSHILRKKGQRDDMDGFLAKGFKLKL